MKMEISDVFVKKEGERIKFVLVELKDEGEESGLKVFINGKFLSIDGWRGKDEEGYESVWDVCDIKLELLKKVRLSLEENVDSLIRKSER